MSKPSKLAGGQIIGFQVSVADFDTEPGKWHSFHSFDGTGGAFLNADNFVDGELIPCHVEDCSRGDGGTAVQAESWGRIKASFR